MAKTNETEKPQHPPAEQTAGRAGRHLTGDPALVAMNTILKAMEKVAGTRYHTEVVRWFLDRFTDFNSEKAPE